MDSENPKRVHMIGLRMGHHASASGYDRLFDFVACQRIEQHEKPNLLERSLARLFKTRIRSAGSTWYHRNQFIAELTVMRRWLAGRKAIFHFLYGENSFRFAGGLKRLSKRNYLIATYHTPPGRFEEVVQQRGHLANLDAIITMSSLQRDYFSRYLDPERVFFIPHGIDIDAYRPDTDIGKDPREFVCVFVGSHLRDFDTLRAVIGKVAQLTDKVTFHIVSSSPLCSELSQLAGVELLSGVTDSELLKLYQSANLLVLPVLEATANNSLLEGMACGLPVVATDLPGIRDYVDPDCSILTDPRDSDSMANAIVALQRDPERLERMALSSRANAERFSWQRVAEQVYAVYRKVAE